MYSSQGTQYTQQAARQEHRLSADTRRYIIALHLGQGFTMRTVAHKLQVPISTISNVVQTFRNTGRIQAKSRRGLKKQLDPALTHRISSLRDLGFSFRQISAELLSQGVKLGKSYVCDIVKRMKETELALRGNNDVCLQFDNSVEFAEFGIYCELDLWID